jgi:hypothetical protein
MKEELILQIEIYTNRLSDWEVYKTNNYDRLPFEQQDVVDIQIRLTAEFIAVLKKLLKKI